MKTLSKTSTTMSKTMIVLHVLYLIVLLLIVGALVFYSVNVPYSEDHIFEWPTRSIVGNDVYYGYNIVALRHSRIVKITVHEKDLDISVDTISETDDLYETVDRLYAKYGAVCIHDSVRMFYDSVTATSPPQVHYITDMVSKGYIDEIVLW